MTKGWNALRRARQRAMIRDWQPWQSSSGPKTETGKRAVAVNAYKHGARSRSFLEECRRLEEALAEAEALRLAAKTKISR